METHTYLHLPAEVATVHLGLFSNVSNAKELKERLVTASNMPGVDGEREQEAVNYAFIDAKLVTSRLQIQTAIYQAVLAHAQGTSRTKTVHSEILWCMNPTHNISEAIKRFGVSDASTSLVVIRISSPTFTVQEFEVGAQLVVKGVLTPLTSLGQFTDWDLVRKFYKLSTDTAIQANAWRKIGPNNVDCEAQKRVLMDQIVISSIAMKSVSA